MNDRLKGILIYLYKKHFKSQDTEVQADKYKDADWKNRHPSFISLHFTVPQVRKV